jgi:RNA polymerase sigma factor (sigma-70 family)
MPGGFVVPALPSTEGFVNRVNAASPSVGDEIVARYFDRLYQYADRHIGRRLAADYSATDAVQSAFGSFFRGMKRGNYHFERSGKLWGLLVTILRHKIADGAPSHSKHRLEDEPADDDHLPEQAAELVDAIEAAVAGFKPKHQEICRLCYQDELSVSEIGPKVGCTRWTVRRVLNEFGKRLNDHLNPPSVI